MPLGGPGAHRDAVRLRQVAARRFDQPARQQAVADDRLFPGVDVVEEGVQRLHPLDQPALHVLPLPGGNDPRDDVERPGPLDALLLAVHREGDALLAEEALDQPDPRPERCGVEVVEPANQRLVVGTRPAGVLHFAEPEAAVVGEDAHLGGDDSDSGPANARGQRISSTTEKTGPSSA
jgi:hypothetical protein